MLKMILAEDETAVRRGLKNIIPWEKLGIEIISEAVNGQEAFDLCQELKPDILFTDIRMPIMDGLELAVKLKEVKSSIRIVFISGAQDFNYAKTALDVDADGYILKPVKINEVTEVFQKVVSWIKFERNRQSEVTHLKQQQNEYFPVIREKFLQNLLMGAYSDKTQIKDKIKYFKLPYDVNESLLVSVMQIDDYSKTTENTSEEDKQLLSFSVTNIVDEIVSNYSSGISFCLNESEFVIIFNQSVQVNGKYNEICEELTTCLSKFLNISISIGIGTWVEGISSINSSYKDARTALQYKFYTGKSSVLDINDINIINNTTVESLNSSQIYETENQLMGFIKLGDIEGASNVLDSLFNNLCSDRNVPVDYIQSICVEIICIASRTTKEIGQNLSGIFGNQAAIIEEIYRKENVEALRLYISDTILRVCEYFSKKYSQKNSKVILTIKDIIDQRYSEDLSIAKISEEVFLTPNYISMIFKQEMNETITNYIIKVRMETAKNLLKSTDMKILEISRKVGYEDPHYFSKAFKKYTGTHPQKYRDT